jgi:hypothetical protein
LAGIDDAGNQTAARQQTDERIWKRGECGGVTRVSHLGAQADGRDGGDQWLAQLVVHDGQVRGAAVIHEEGEGAWGRGRGGRRGGGEGRRGGEREWEEGEEGDEGTGGGEKGREAGEARRRGQLAVGR